MRKYFIDNIRWIAVLFLFPYHTARIFDGVRPFYVKGPAVQGAAAFVLACTPWFMPVLFAAAGASARYALERRSGRAYLRERTRKLLVPLISGILLLIPVQTYFAERFHNGYTGSYGEQYILFFTKPTDFSGYSGGFTPGQLWFIFYLFLISLITLPLICFAKNRHIGWHDRPGVLAVPLFLVTLPCSYLLDVGGKSLGEALSLFLLGYFVLSEDSVQRFLDQHRHLFTLLGGVLIVYTVLNQTALKTGGMDRAVMVLTSWLCILAIFGLGRRHLDVRNKWTDRLSGLSFPFYLFHQSWIVLIGFYALRLPLPAGGQAAVILAGSLAGSTLTGLLCRRSAVLRFLFAVKASRRSARSGMS